LAQPGTIWFAAAFLVACFALAGIRRWPWVVCAIMVLCLASDARVLTRDLRIPARPHADTIGTVPHPLMGETPASVIQRLYPVYPNYGGIREEMLPGNTALFRGYSTLGGYCPLMSKHLLDYFSISQTGDSWNFHGFFENPAPL